MGSLTRVGTAGASAGRSSRARLAVALALGLGLSLIGAADQPASLPPVLNGPMAVTAPPSVPIGTFWDLKRNQPLFAALTFVGTQTASATSLTAPAHQKGDILVYGAVRGGSTTAPTLPAGYVNVTTKSNSTATSVSIRAGYRIATGIGAFSSTAQSTSTGIFTTAANGLAAGQAIQITGSLPGGFAANTWYYVLAANLSSTTCQLATTPFGSAKVPTSSVSTTLDTDPSGTWTNAAELICQVYRPSNGYTVGLGQIATPSSSTTATVTYPTVGLADTSGNSWVVAFTGAGNKTQTLTTAPTGMTNQSSVVGSTYSAAGFDTNGGVSSWTAATANVGSTGSTVTVAFELMLLPSTAATSLTGHVYQHMKCGGNPYANNAGSTTPFKYVQPVNWVSGAGNTLVLQITYDGGVAAPTVVGSVNGTFTAGPTALGGSGNQDTRTYYKQGISAGQETITVTFAATTRAFGFDAITELYGVATSGGLAGSTSSAYSTTTAAGSFTPTNNNGTGGNFIWASFVVAEQIPVGTTPNIRAGGAFTLMGADTAWNDSGGDGEMFAKAQQGYVQATSAAVNPAVTVVGQGADHWNSLAMAFPISSGSGTAPPSFYIDHISFLSTTHFPASGTYTFQVCATGNLRCIQSPDPNLNALIVTDSEGNAWSSDGTAKPAFWYLANAGANPNLQVYITGGGTDNTLSWRYIDIVGAASSPFDSAIDVADSIGAVTTYTPTAKISPSNTNGIVLYGIGIGLGPGLAVTAPTGAVWQYPTFSGETDGDLAVNADIGAYYLNTASGSITATFTITSNASNSSSGGIIAFAAGAGGSAGTAAVVETGDVLSASGSLTALGAAAIIEGLDCIAATGAPAGASGAAAILEASDIISTTGSLSASASASILESTDAPAGLGSLTASGAAAISESGDIVVASAGAIASGSAAVVEGVDSPSAAGSLSASASAAITEASDTTTAAGSVGVSGAAAVVESQDAISASANLSAAGSAAISERADIIGAAGALSVSGTASIQEGVDVAQGTGGNGVFATAAILEAPDVVVSAGSLAATAAATALERSDSLAAAGSASLSGAAAILERPDSVAGSGFAGVTGFAAIVESGDITVATAILVAVGIAGIVEPHDAVFAVGSVSATGAASIIETSDLATASGGVAVIGVADIVESSDAVTASGVFGNDVEGSAAIYESSDAAAALGYVGTPVIAGRIALSIITNKSSLDIVQNHSSMEIVQ